MIPVVWSSILIISQLFITGILTFSIYPRSVFPIKLGESVHWLLSTSGGADHMDFWLITLDFDGSAAFRIGKSECKGPESKYFTCQYKSQTEIAITFTPKDIHYGTLLTINYYRDSDSLWQKSGDVLFKQRIELTKQPSYIKMEMHLKDRSRYEHDLPLSLRLEPPIFITGSQVRIDCISDGALPPVPVSFSIECPPPPPAAVEHDRVTQANEGLPYEKFYRYFHFTRPPTLLDLTTFVAKKNARELLRLGHVVLEPDNKTLHASLSINEKAHDCHVVCRLSGKEVRQRLTVYYPTTMAYILPRLHEGGLAVGSELTCHADGHPPPTTSLRLTPPLRRKEPLTKEELQALDEAKKFPKNNRGNENRIDLEFRLANHGLETVPAEAGGNGNSASADTLQQLPHDELQERWSDSNYPPGTYDPSHGGKRIPGIGLSTIDRSRELGLHPNEYTIRGATFKLAHNATPGVELVLTCLARNVLPGDTSFLGMDGTMTRTRFVVTAVSRASLFITLGVCALVAILLISIIIALILQKRHQSGFSNSERLASSNGTKKPVSYGRSPYNKRKPTPKPTPAPSSRLVAQPYNMGYTQSLHPQHQQALIQDQLYTGDPMYNYDPSYTASPMMDTETFAMTEPTDAQIQYVQLSFDPAAPTPTDRPSTSNQRASSLGHGPTSASMTLFGNRSPNHQFPSQRVYGASVPQDLDSAATHHQVVERSLPREDDGVGDDGTHYTEIVAVMQPKAHSSQLVLQQQQEATQALLAMHQARPRQFV